MKKYLQLSVLMFSIGVFFIACQNTPQMTNPDSQAKFTEPDMVISSLVDFGTLQSAELFLYIDTDAGLGAAVVNNQTVNVHRVTAEWDEMTVTWNSFYDNPTPYDADVMGNFIVDEIDWKSVDITPLVEMWLSGTTNYGLLLDQVNKDYPRALYHSRENSSGNGPYLKLTFESDSGTHEVILNAVADTYIWELSGYADTNYGGRSELFTGWKNSSDLEKQTLIRFEFDAGCTLTPGYWKTHADPDKKKYDDTWDMLSDGPNTVFYLSGQSYLEVLWTPPRGNEYYILAFQFIAAQLNDLAGADISVIADDLDRATYYFENYTPDNPSDVDFPRSEVVHIAEFLDDYNNGNLWPFHCSD